MATTESSPLALKARDPQGSRSARRLRREGLVPGVIYGGGEDPQHFSVDARILRNTLAHAGQVIEITVDGGATGNVLIKDVQRHPVRGEATHVDLLRVRMDVAIHATVPIEFTGSEAGARRRRGRHLQPGAARGQHRGAARRHPGLDRPRRLGARDERHRHARGADRAAGRHAARRRRDASSRRSRRRRSSRSRRRSRPRPRWSARTASRSRAKRPPRARAPRRRPNPNRTRAEALLVHTG